MSARVGDRIIVEARTTSTTKHAGVIEEVLDGETPRYVVHWDDGRTSVFSPSAGSARIEAVGTRKRTKANGGTSTRSGASSRRS